MSEIIQQEEVFHLAQRGLFIRGEITKPEKNGKDKAKIFILSGLHLAKGVCINYIEYRYTYYQLQNGRDFVSHLEQKVFTPDKENYYNTLGVLRIWDNWGHIKLFEKLWPEVIVTKSVDFYTTGPIFKQLPLADPAVISHLARFQGMIGQTRNPQIQDYGLEQVYVRLGALISQQLKKWNQMVG